MATLTWEKVGDRIYHTGLDRAVLYLKDGTAVAWNGLTSVEEDSNNSLTSYYLDGVKFLDNLAPGDFIAVLKAFTYPDEFDQVIGLGDVTPGLTYHDQPFQSFNLAYRTRVGNDLDGTDFGYKIHLLFNLIANPQNFAYETIKDSVTAIEFAWNLTGTPTKVPGARPTVHITIDSRDTDPIVLEAIENMLYGTATTGPHFPTIDELTGIFAYYGALIITDNGDGTWTALDESDSFITMTDPTTFRIDNADATFTDVSTYQISSTNTG